MSDSEGTSNKEDGKFNHSPNIFESSEVVIKSPKKRKKSSSASTILTKDDITDSGTSQTSFTKKKKSKKSRDQSELEATDLEEKSSQPQLKSYVSEELNENHIFSETSLTEASPRKKKKKKTASREQSELEATDLEEKSSQKQLQSYVSEELNESYAFSEAEVSPKKKKKRKTASSFDSGVAENSHCEKDVSQFNGTSNERDKIIKYISSKPEYKRISIHPEKNATVDIDDEIWILKCPANIPVEGFLNKELKPKSKSKIKIAEKRYECFYKDQPQNYLTLSPKSGSKGSFTLLNILSQGLFSIKPKIPKLNPNEDKIVQQKNQFIPLPETKRRHPFFGAEYQQFIDIPSTVNDRLNPQSETIYNAVTKKFKKERILKEAISEDSDFSRKKKKKKRKRSQSDNESATPAKKVKKERSQVEDWSSERNIEENLFNC